jgi:hypothetical protein
MLRVIHVADHVTHEVHIAVERRYLRGQLADLYLINLRELLSWTGELDAGGEEMLGNVRLLLKQSKGRGRLGLCDGFGSEGGTIWIGSSATRATSIGPSHRRTNMYCGGSCYNFN